MGAYVVGILNPGFGTTFRYIDFNDENNGIQNLMKIIVSSLWQCLMAVKR